MVPRHTVVETAEFLAQAKKLFSEEERTLIIDMLSHDPDVGEVIRGTGGFRKVRVARKGSGKSGGYRVIYFFANEHMPVMLVSVYAKPDKENVTEAERNAMYNMAQIIKKGASNG